LHHSSPQIQPPKYVEWITATIPEWDWVAAADRPTATDRATTTKAATTRWLQHVEFWIITATLDDGVDQVLHLPLVAGLLKFKDFLLTLYGDGRQRRTGILLN